MADPLSLLRQYNMNKKEILERENQIIFGDFSCPKNVVTNFLICRPKNEQGIKEYYTLECLLFLLKNINLIHPVYVQQAADANIPAVRRPDRKNILAYLNGETDTCTSIDKSVPMEKPKQVKRTDDCEVGELVVKKPHTKGITVGDYIIIQKQSYRKLHKFNKSDSSITLGRDSINLNGIEGMPYFSYFKLNSSNNKRNRVYTVEFTEETITLKDEIDIKVSGNDNRNIQDDGHSQKLSAADIEVLKSDSNKASDIVETLITNSNTFHNKTEFSQEKYLKKKEKKYFEYIQILRPNLRLVAEIMYKLEPAKIQNLRLDTLSQIVTMANIQCEGVHLLYDSGSNGLLAAALLNAIGEKSDGNLVHMHPGNMSQKQALLALNFDEEQLKRCVSVNVYSALRQYYQGCDTNENSGENNTAHNPLKRKNEEDTEHDSKVPKVEDQECTTPVVSSDKIVNEDIKIKPEPVAHLDSKDTNMEEVAEVNSLPEPKKPKWHFDNIAAADILRNKVDSLVIASKEDPQNIFKELVGFVKPGRPFVVYYPVAEPLQNMYLSLKPLGNVSALKLTCSWMRNYQVLPDRTHPEVLMNGSSGFILSGYILK